MKKICIIFGHHNSKSSFNAAIRDTFIEEAKRYGHTIDLINLFEGIEPSSSVNNMLAAAVIIEQCEQLYAAGVRQFHFYTLNKSDLTSAVCHSLGVRTIPKVNRFN